MCNTYRKNNINYSRIDISIFFFPLLIFYHELLLRAFDQNKTAFFDLALLRTLLFAMSAGLLAFLLLDLLPWRKFARAVGGAFIVSGTIILCVERGCRATFGLYYGISFMGDMAGNVDQWYDTYFACIRL